MSRLALAIATKSEWDPGWLLGRLTAAGVPSSAEIHIACDERFAPVTSAPGLRVHAEANASLFELWAAAVQGSNAPWVAILHADALPAPGWFDAMQRAIEEHPLGEGFWGAVEPDFAGSASRMIGYLTEYCQFHRPIEPNLSEVPGSNLVLPRGRISVSSEFSKTRLLRQGFTPKRIDDAVVLYARPFALADYCRRRFRHGRAYAAARTPRLSLVRAVPLAAALPFLRSARVLRHAWRHAGLRAASLRWLPAILLVESFWSVGELCGYLTRRPGQLSALD